MKLVITESERNHILDLYGLLEQAMSAPLQTKNSDGSFATKTNAGKYNDSGGYKPTQDNLKVFNYTNTFPNLKAKDSKDWQEKASIYLGHQLEVLKSQKGWSVTPCNACSTTLSGSLAKDIANKKLCVNSSLAAKTWKCPEGYSFYSIMGRDYGGITDWVKMSKLVKSAPNKVQYDPIKELGMRVTHFVGRINKEGIGVVFEALRDALTSIVGAATQVIVDFFGGGLAVEIVWMILLGWDAYQVTQGNFNIVNLLTDIAGIVTFGPGGSWLWGKMTTLSAEGGEITLTRFGKWLESEPLVLDYFKNFNFDNAFKKTLGKTIELMEKDVILSEFVVSLNGIYQKLLPYLERLSGKEIVAAAEKGAEKAFIKSGGKATKETGKEVYDFASDVEKQTTGTNYLASNRDYVSTASKYADKSSTLTGKALTPK
jgi:hypothetical protein